MAKMEKYGLVQISHLIPTATIIILTFPVDGVNTVSFNLR
jgi:hypothetical protein